jgi:hypothetical protein
MRKEDIMERRLPNPAPQAGRNADDRWNLNDLLHPAQAFRHPLDVVNDRDLTLNEKRAILASWASDACALEAAPSLRCAPGAQAPVAFDDVMDALRLLDGEAGRQSEASARYKRLVRRNRMERRSWRRGPQDQALN